MKITGAPPHPHTLIAWFKYLYSPEYLLLLGPANMAVLQDFIAAVHAASLYIGIFAVCAYGLSSYTSYRRLAHIKGPFLAGWSNFWLVRTVYNLNTHQELYLVNKKYGMLLFLSCGATRLIIYPLQVRWQE
jgi:hypothetical protein